MAIGFIYTGTTYATPDKSMTKTSTPRMRTAKFGDGYEQRIVDGINNLEESYSLSFKTRLKADIDDIVAFLDTKAGVTKFTLTLPDTNNTTRTGERDVKVVSTNYSVTYDYDSFYSLSLTLKRVFEA
jgi:phage-related protein